MSEDTKTAGTIVRTPEVRLAFPALFEPKPRSKDKPDVKTFQAVLLIPPSVKKELFTNAIKAAMIEKWGKVIPLPASKNPLRDCAEKPGLAGYEAGWTYINTHSKFKPGVVDRLLVPVTDPSKVYPGMWVKAHINAFVWDHPTGGKGVSFGLNAIQLVRDDERLDGRVDATALFEPLDAPAPTSGTEGGDTEDLFS